MNRYDKDCDISIFIPVYNSEKYIASCINSIQNQDIKKIEIVIYDDGSTDNSYAICEEIAKNDSRVVLKHGDNGSFIEAMNEFTLYANGKYIAFVDNDDYIGKDYLSKLYKKIVETKADMAVGSFCCVGAENELLGWYSPKLEECVLSSREACVKFLTSFDIEGFRWNKLVRKDIFKYNIEFSRSFPADIYPEYKMLSFCENVVLVDSKSYYYRQHINSSVSQLDYKKICGYISAFKRVSIEAKKQGLINESKYYYIYRCINCLFEVYREWDKFDKNEKKKIKKDCSWDGVLGDSLGNVISVLVRYKNKRDGLVKTIIKTVIVRIIYK